MVCCQTEQSIEPSASNLDWNEEGDGKIQNLSHQCSQETMENQERETCPPQYTECQKK